MTNVLRPALRASNQAVETPAGRVNYYVGGRDTGRPLLLIHSVNAAASAYEVRPLFDHFVAQRRVYALELPGFGMSERRAQLYTPRLMTDAIHAVVAEIGRRDAPGPLDALALSLGCEFLARAATERPDAFRSLALVSPTGLSATTPAAAPQGTHRGKPRLHGALANRPWSRALFDLLTSRASVRFFLRKTFGRREIDEGLVEYCLATARQPGAEHAPLCFLAGFLFSADIRGLYGALTQPAWLVHGVRGDFTDYTHARELERRRNWRLKVMQTGAMPYFEQRDAFVHAYESFLSPTGSADRASG